MTGVQTCALPISPPDVLISYSDFIHQLETTNNTLAVDFVESRDIREAIGATVNYKYVFTGAGILQQYFSYIDFTPAKASESSAVLAQKYVPVLPTHSKPVDLAPPPLHGIDRRFSVFQ